MAYLNRDEKVELNLAPMLDVVILLLCFFVLTAQLRSDLQTPESLTVESSQGSAARRLSPNSTLLTLTRSGEVSLNGTNYRLNQQALASALEAHGAQQEDIILSADALTAHHLVIELMDLVTTLGYARLRVAVTPGSTQTGN